MFICKPKFNFIPYAFMEILQRYANLFWVLWTCLVTLIQNDSITLQKTLMFICVQKINFIIHFFLMILQFSEHCNLIDWWYFDKKTNMTKFIEKPKKPYFGAILGPFCKNEFFWKKRLCQFFNTRIIYHCAKNKINLMSHS